MRRQETDFPLQFFMHNQSNQNSNLSLTIICSEYKKKEIVVKLKKKKIETSRGGVNRCIILVCFVSVRIYTQRFLGAISKFHNDCTIQYNTNTGL